MFNRAIVRRPCKHIIKGITSKNLEKVNYKLALHQHTQYINALKECGLEVFTMAPDERYPDSVFIEDTALLTSKCAIITNPGAESRKGETIRVKGTLEKFYGKIEYVKNPGTLDAGDVMQVGDSFYIGLSGRTNRVGAGQLKNILRRYGFKGLTIKLKDVLHLKSGVSYLENNKLAACGEFLSKSQFKNFAVIKIAEEEAYAANCLWINDYVLIPKGYPKTKKAVEESGYKTIILDMSEFKKLDGGLSCLSLRF